jgi:tetratricopeptide (TPR) repeat protein
MKPVNPYIVGNPIKDQAGFFGRLDIFREVLQVLRQRGSNAIVLYGQRRIGKTSVLLQLEKQLRRDGEFTPVYFDLQDKAAKSLIEVLYELSQHISRVTGHTIAKSSDFDRTGDYFRSIFLPEIAQKVASGGLVLLFDEFDVLDSPARTQASEAFFPYLRRWMDDVQKVKFVFVIGRRPEDLSVRTMSTFKGVQSTRVSFLSKPDAIDVIRQSEREGTLQWDESAVQHVIDLTHGHPYFTQLLCSVVWENAYESAPDTTPTISVQDVEKAVLPALKFGANAFNWLWDGLPPAERVVVAAMAEVKEDIITQDKLIETLNLSGVRLVARELEVAPETLIDWEVLIESDGAYRFAVPLLRRWVLTNRPLRRVKEELDRLNPLADGLYQTGYGYYDRENPDLDAAVQQLQQALNINPNHLKARLLLGQILLEKGNLIESVNMFDAAYQYDERAARADLIKSLLALAETQDENLQLSTYERILKIQSDQPLANEKMRAIWVKRGEAAQAQESYEEALKIFEQIGDTERIEKVRSLMHEKKLALDMQRADAYEKSGQWKSALETLVGLIPEYPESETLRARMETARVNWRSESLLALDASASEENWAKALELCETLEKDFPDDTEIKSHVDRARAQIGVTQKYQQALGVLQGGQNDDARQLLAQVLAEDPKHLNAAHKLIEATYGKVKILSHVPLGVYFLAFISAMVWTLSILFGLSGWAANLIAKYYVDANQGTIVSYYIIRVETFIGLGAILILFVGVLLSSYMNNVIDITYQVERDKISYIKALWTHAVLGMGLFYAKPEARRKWLYALIALLISLLVLAQIFFELTKFMRIQELHFETVENGLVVNILGATLWVFLAMHILSFADVIGACYARRRNYRGTKREMREVLPSQVKASQFELTQMKPIQTTSEKFQMPVRGLPGWILSPIFLIVAVGILPMIILAIIYPDALTAFVIVYVMIMFVIGAFVLGSKFERSGSMPSKENPGSTNDVKIDSDSKT